MMTLVFALALAPAARPELLVETEWLATHLTDPTIRVVDMRVRGYDEGHIPGAIHLRNDDIRRAGHPPTFLPSPADFETLMDRLGISNATRVIAYDDRGGIYAARLWWILNYHGHANVALLNGGWTKWSKEARPVSTAAADARSTKFVAHPNPRWLATAADVMAAIDRPGTKIVDARTRAEIEGRELRGIRRGGFIPSSIPIYWEDALDPQVRSFKPVADLQKLYLGAGLRPDDEIITYCQVGMRASHDLFVLHLLGFDRLRNYYGSWEEWGNRDDLPIATVPPKH